jgi:hypothetical protein
MRIADTGTLVASLLMPCFAFGIELPPAPDLASLPPWAQVQKPPIKRALVIGIDQYQHVQQLKTPAYDASLVAHTLKDLDPNIAVTVVPPAAATRDGILDAIEAFAKTIGPGDVAFIYFSGHGVEKDEVNYLVPIDATVADPGREGFVYVSLPYLLEQIRKASPGITVIILDACREDPFSSSSPVDDELDPPAQSASVSASPTAPTPGANSTTTDNSSSGIAPAKVQPAPVASGAPVAPVAPVASGAPVAPVAIAPGIGLVQMVAPSGFLVAYAAEPKKVSYSLFRGESPETGSIFTRRLVNLLATMTEPVRTVFDSTSGDVSRLTGARQTPFLDSANAGQVMLQKNIYYELNEQESWVRSVVGWPNDQQLPPLQHFVDLYPAGPFSGAARQRIAELQQNAVQAPILARVPVPAPPPPVVVSGALTTPPIVQASASVAIASHDLFVRAAPRAATPPVIATLKKGDRVQVLAANVRPGWAKVVLPEGNVGYVGSIATPSSAPQPEVSSIKVVGDQLPDVTQGPFADQWRNALKQPTYAIRVTSGPAKDVNPWRARQLAFLRALRVRSALIGQGADGTRISVTLENALVPTDTTIVTLTRVNKP